MCEKTSGCLFTFYNPPVGDKNCKIRITLILFCNFESSLSKMSKGHLDKLMLQQNLGFAAAFY